ncbi:complement component 1 Q subcomponent-binding protein, mitochondrial-like [Antedon mediterranea]|uniref:complement component 1 Q subcomponent-binding protein, mitochondrial-like n=1 Tax=Antedon mediterranea TaxID=105859 RepID=UPI003AF8D6C9
MAFNVSKVAYRLLTNIGKTSLCISASNRLVYKSFNNVNTSSRAFTRSLWYAINPTMNGGVSVPPEIGGISGHSKLCACGCAGMHTEGDKELAQFLEDEIKLEKKNQTKGEAQEVDDFTKSVTGSTVSLSKNDNGEKIVVSFNVNHSVEADEDSAEGENEDAESLMRSYPDFNVEITKESQQTLSLKCSFSTELNEGEAEDQQEEDTFIIDEVSIYKDTATDKVYTVGSEVMDGDLYDLLMNMLEERGIDDAFTDKLCDLATSVEHSQYIQFLQNLKDIAKS